MTRRYLAELTTALERYRGFRGEEPHSVARVQVPAMPRVLLTIGECLGIMYRTSRDGRTENFLHRFFKKGARPTLAASSDGRTLYLLGGAYRLTDRGVEDDA